ncbi:GNAT family N-acetyltransferase [Streptomyces somaliensis]|uniref:GNAT family N-acetyltransferase n=1 Tax=Streptomyces somaliensis TaxID=78355 RepID=UPI003F7520E1
MPSCSPRARPPRAPCSTSPCGTACGSATCGPARRDLPTGERVPYVWEVAVAEGERRRGHGRALMRFAEGLVRAQGGDRLALRVDPGNTAARALYASLGYRPLFTDCEKTLY